LAAPVIVGRLVLTGRPVEALPRVVALVGCMVVPPTVAALSECV
jgi:hypothetical protein